MSVSIPQEVYDKFETLALDVKAAGYKHYSSDAILHRIRWHMHIERGNREFKANNNWTAHLARWFLARHPGEPKFFELRVRRRHTDTVLPEATL
jgi:hypothetical protein